MSDINPFILKENEEGEIWAEDNPEYDKILNEKKFEIELKRSGIPVNYYNLDFDNYVGKRSLNNKKTAQDFALRCREEELRNISLYVVGSNSTQKTMVACAIGKEFIRQGYKIKFILAGHLIDKLIKSQGYAYIKEIEQEIKSFFKTDLVIIDDIFDPKKSVYWNREGGKELIITAWDNFLRHLISNNVRIILTSNYELDHIKEKFGNDLYQLLYRNFQQLLFYDNISETRRERLINVFSDGGC